MLTFRFLAFSILTAASAGALAQLTPQQERMKECNVTAGSQKLKGDERQAFMSSCLKGEEPKQLTSQQEKMRTCNQAAGDRQLKGDERQRFMSSCLKSDAAAGSSR